MKVRVKPPFMGSNPATAFLVEAHFLFRVVLDAKTGRTKAEKVSVERGDKGLSEEQVGWEVGCREGGCRGENSQ